MFIIALLSAITSPAEYKKGCLKTPKRRVLFEFIETFERTVIRL